MADSELQLTCPQSHHSKGQFLSSPEPPPQQTAWERRKKSEEKRREREKVEGRCMRMTVR